MEMFRYGTKYFSSGLTLTQILIIPPPPQLRVSKVHYGANKSQQLVSTLYHKPPVKTDPKPPIITTIPQLPSIPTEFCKMVSIPALYSGHPRFSSSIFKLGQQWFRKKKTSNCGRGANETAASARLHVTKT